MILRTIAGIDVFQDDDGRVHFEAGADIDADGSPHAYHPDDVSGLDCLADAKDGDQWVGIVAWGGTPIIQLSTDPAPGFYVSTTSYEWPQFGESDPSRYVDAERVPYIVVPGIIRRLARGVVLGCLARATYNGKIMDCVVADVGPSDKAGEMSIFAAASLGIPSSARTGGVDGGVLYEFWPGFPATINGALYNLQPAGA